MSDRIRFSARVTPIEELTDENAGNKDIIASEVGRSIGGSGDGIDIDDYNQTANVQGYKDAAVNYRDAVHTAGGVQLTSLATCDGMIIKNTGYKYSSATVLGDETTDVVIVVIHILAHDSGGNGGWVTGGDNDKDHFLELAWLKPGQAMILPAGARSNGVSQFGSNAFDLTALNELGGMDNQECEIYVKTVEADGSAASDGNAVEFLAVT